MKKIALILTLVTLLGSAANAGTTCNTSCFGNSCTTTCYSY
jgi:hypothetical protein